MLTACAATPSGRAVLLDGEVELATAASVRADLEGVAGAGAGAARALGALVVTSHRAVLLSPRAGAAGGNGALGDSAVPDAVALRLGDIARIEPDSGLINTTKLRKKKLRVYARGGGAVPAGTLVATFVFTQKGHGGIARALEAALERRAWERGAAAAASPSPAAAAVSGAASAAAPNAQVGAASASVAGIDLNDLNEYEIEQMRALGLHVTGSASPQVQPPLLPHQQPQTAPAGSDATEGAAGMTAYEIEQLRELGVAIPGDEAAPLPPPQTPVPAPPTSAASSAPVPSFTTRSAGVSGIIRQQSMEEAQANASVSEAFTDLSSLMEHARELVALADKMRGFERRDTAASGAGAEDAAEAAATAEMGDFLLTLGLASPVTKTSAGSMYHQELSRQLADFLPRVLDNAGGLMALPEVYCVYNRARGSELVSPADLLQACSLWETLGLPLSLQTFGGTTGDGDKGGVLCVCAARFSQEDLHARLVELAESMGDGSEGLSAEDAAMVLACPPAVTREMLRAAEGTGKLCRDEAGAGVVRWHRNFFADIR